MVSKSYIDVLKYPLLTWFAFDVISFFAGFSSFVNISTQMLLGNGAIFVSILFGVWVGRRAAKAFGRLWVSMLCAIMLTVIIGFIGTLATAGLSIFSGSFQMYTGQSGINLTSPILNAAITLWFIMAMISVAGAALAHEFSSNK